MTFLRIAKHELRQILREPKFLLPFLLPPIILICTQFTLVSVSSDYPDGGTPVSLSMFACAFLLSPMVIPLASDSFAGERERGSLELLQLLPVNPLQIFWGKLLALLPVPLFFLFVAETIFAIAFFNDSFMFVFSIWFAAVWVGFCGTILFAVISLVVSLLLVKSARAANQISLLFYFALFLGFRFVYDSFLTDSYSLVVLGVVTFALCTVLTLLGQNRFRSL